ncbi:hypothetical protein ACIRSD_43045 [Streptomyces acidicola]|uniref:hypothetical protein n=1 Tax=Streptomyces acidicola TaxID=2596892 RepID=UPI00380E47EE
MAADVHRTLTTTALYSVDGSTKQASSPEVAGRVGPAMEREADAGLWADELESLLLQVGVRFGRVEPRRRMRDYVRGLLVRCAVSA